MQKIVKTCEIMIYKTTKLNNATAWSSLFDSPERIFEFTDAPIQLQLIEAGAMSWMILCCYTSDTSSTDYSFLPENKANLPDARRHIFNFLATLNYSLPQLLAWLGSAHFAETEVDESVIVGGLRISRNFARATVPMHHAAKGGEVIFEEFDHEKDPG